MENSNNSMLQTPPIHRPTPPASPYCGGGGGGEDPWIPEISLNSLLNISSLSNGRGGSPAPGATNGGGTPSASQLNTPHQPSSAVHLMCEDSSQSTGSEVDRHILSMMTENSVDF